MKRINVETVVGLFLVAGFACFAYLAARLGDVNLLGAQNYHVKAYFSSVAGLKPGASVEIAGVNVGKVSEIDLDQETYEALVTLEIEKDVKIKDDTIASIKTAGIIGDKYVSLKPGGSDTYLKDGDVIADTESAIDIEELVSKYIFEKE